MPEDTPNLGLKKPIEGELDWDTPLRETLDMLDDLIPGKADVGHDHDGVYSEPDHTHEGGGGSETAWWTINASGDMPVETYMIVRDIDTTTAAITAAIGGQTVWTQSTPAAYVAASAGSTISSVQCLASAPQSISLVRVALQKITDPDGTFLAMPGSYAVHYSMFNPGTPVDTVALGPFPAVAVSGNHFTFPDADDADYNVAGSIITIKNAGMYRLIVDVSWVL